MTPMRGILMSVPERKKDMRKISEKNTRPLENTEIQELAPASYSTQPIKSASEKYSFVPTIGVVNLLRDVGWVPVYARQALVRKPERDGFQKHMIRFTKPCLNFGGERVDLILYNSHDCGCAFNLTASVWRKICSNGLMVSNDMFNFSHKHINFDADQLIQSSLTIGHQAGILADNVEKLKAIEMTPDERGVYAMAAHQLVYANVEDAPIAPDKLLTEKRYDDNNKDLWTTFNVVQENIIRGGLPTDYSYRNRIRSNGGRPQKYTRGIKSLDKDIKLNKSLWTLTEYFQSLKTKMNH